MRYEPTVELEMNLDELRKDKIRLDEELQKVEALISKYEKALKLLGNGVLDY